MIQAGGISKCKFNKLHKCSVCSDAKWASYKHRQEAQLNSVSSSIDTPDVQNQITSTVNAGFEKLVSHLSGSKSNVSDSENLPLFGMPSVVTNKVDLPNLSNHHIRGIDISLPLDSCYSVSLCSLEHAKLMEEKYPSSKLVKLPSPIPIHVANKDAVLQGVGTHNVRIDWVPGKYSVHTMLVVPKLSFPVLFGNNHLELCDPVVAHKE